MAEKGNESKKTRCTFIDTTRFMVWDGLVIFFFIKAAVAEEERDAPDCCKSHQSENYTAHSCRLPAEQVGDKIKSKKTNKAPVNPAYDCQY